MITPARGTFEVTMNLQPPYDVTDGVTLARTSLTKVFQGILLFYVLACDSLIVYRVRFIHSVRKPAHAA